MQKVKIALLALMIIMSVLAGGAKLLLMPQEVRLFIEAGLDRGLVVPLGLAQLVGALLAAFHKTRTIGLIVMAAGFLASVGAVFRAGDVRFAAVSMLPFIICLWLARAKERPAH